jgi:hypothetical protein
MSSTSSPPDTSNIVHGVFPTQALRVGDGRRVKTERLPEETTRGAEQESAALTTSGGDAAGPPKEEAQACFAFIESDDEGRGSERGQAPSAAADALPQAAQAMVSEAMATPPQDGAFDLQEGGGRATPDAAAVVFPEPPEDATSASAADAEPHTLEARTDEAVGEEGTRRTTGEDLAGDPAARTGEPREIDLDAVAAHEIDLDAVAAHEIDLDAVAAHEIDSLAVAAHESAAHEADAHGSDAHESDAHAVVLPELAPYELAPHEVAAEEVVAAEGASDEVAAREGDAGGVAALGITQHEGDTEIAAHEEASYKGTEVLAARSVATHIAPPRAAETREVTFPTLARASLARTADPAAPTPGAPRPLTRALDAAARLAADANAAAAALDSLKRLLQQGLPASGQAEIARAAPAAEHRAQHRPAPLSPRPPPPPPPARPLAVTPLAAVQRAPLPPADRARFDVRGFFAGVALSCAIGIILYLFMTAG